MLDEIIPSVSLCQSFSLIRLSKVTFLIVAPEENRKCLIKLLEI